MLKEKLKALPVVIGATLLPVVNAFAAEGDVTSSMTTALTAVKTDAMSAIGAVAPIAIAIAGAFLVWRLGMRFFKSISK